MRKPVTPPGPPGRPRSAGYGSTGLAPGVTAANSNTRISPATLARPAPAGGAAGQGGNLGLNSDRLRHAMVQRLRTQGITDERVLNAMSAVPRHVFVDEALASRAYEDAALPIGHSQTISQPWVVARMISAACEDRSPTRVLEVGAGCGYQAAVLAQFVREVHAIERIRGLFELARNHLRSLRLATRVRLIHGDGMQGLPGVAPFDAIVVAAAGLAIPQALLEQLAPGGRLIAPEGATNQRLVLVERTGTSSWKRTELEAVRFVPLRAGIQS
ncbi:MULTISPECIES: protein-L-isoaspartate(D-aspartate) O-methyltransferase [Bordetella]|uniref:Protein-L-isoaspartate O-methyltransferase n=2 Tax=Bordetella TaxID=517 RepID=A0A261VQV3_9BORD|nr:MULTISPECIES: protein-L-isoaspartate(D-aspartate) O-methyltransferase [Bordetella]MDM9557481.1 protein-L-isoaspartate(D-aspartate) O-methyltransferase [Bordetella petrii]OZI75960.1 protein-L-isoaspartate O-methyltransferase [Bordetella genomosp. 2]